jgi:probable HAF family extracellular repeat protein
MKSPKQTHLATVILSAMAIPTVLVGQPQIGKPYEAKYHRYKLVDIGTFDGPASNMNPVGNGSPYISTHGVAVGTSATSFPSGPTANGFFCNGLDGTVPFVFHAFEWKNGEVTDLESLAPAVTNCSDALAVNPSGMIAGGSENGLVDPATGVNEIRAVVWKDGEIEDLGTFGGNFSTAESLNSRGQVAGFALNGISDPLSMFALVLGGPSAGTQTRAFLWENGEMKDLGTLGGPDAWGFLLNEHGQVAGYSYTNSTANSTTGFPTVDPFLWKDGRMIDLGSLGGTLGTPSALNNRGQVIGSSNLAGDQVPDPFLWDEGELIDLAAQSGGTIVTANAINDAGEIVGAECLPNNGPCHAYLWKNGVVTDLGSLPGDCFSEAFAINAKAQVVGQSFNCDTQIVRTFLWDNGTMIDLNTFVPPGSGLQLVEAVAINDHGEIAGDLVPSDCGGGIVPTQGNDAQCGHAFVLIPCDDEANDSEGCRDDAQFAEEPTPAGPLGLAATQTTLTPNQIRDRVRAPLAKRVHRFPFLPTK